MTFSDIFLYTGLAGLGLTLLHFLLNKLFKQFFTKQENYLLELIKNWVGALFIFSGIVKAIDPIGTSIKIGEYFEVLHLEFLLPFTLTFSVGMIVAEIVMGAALIVGWQGFITAAFTYLLIIFFTFLTGFTYVSGFCPSALFLVISGLVLLTITITAFLKDPKMRRNGIFLTITLGLIAFLFCKFSHQCLLCAFSEVNMKVTSCGCFGDFIKLKPKQSFTKDLILLVATLYILFNYAKIKPITNKLWLVNTKILLVTIVSLLFCFRNYKFNEPIVDFRPYKIGVNILEDKEVKVAPKVEYIFHYLNKKTGEKYDYKMADLSKITENDTLLSREDIVLDPGIPAKILDFNIQDSASGSEITDDVLYEPAYTFMVVAWDVTKTEKAAFAKINTLAEQAQKAGCKIFSISYNATHSFENEMKITYPMYWGDAVFLKTIGRGNPVILLLKEGKIIDKWHWNKLPTFDEIKKKDLK
jgi:hypothetical protein